MTDVDLGPAAQRPAGPAARVTGDGLGKPAPCPADTLGDLIDHVDGAPLPDRVVALAGRDPGWSPGSAG